MEKRDVTFTSGPGKLKLAGDLYIPNAAQGQKSPAIVAVTPWSSVKSQTSGLYARKLAEQTGFITLAFDNRHYGDSEGEPRCLEDPAGKVEDISSAVDFLTQQELVDPERIGVFGICAGGSYVLDAAAVDRRIKAVATVTGVSNLRRFLEEDFKLGREGLQAFLAQASTARTAMAAGKAPEYVAAYDRANDAKGLPTYAGIGAYEYYEDPARGKVPSYQNKVAVATWSKMFFSAADETAVSYIAPTPLLIIGGTESASKSYQQTAYNNAREPKELFWVEGATHNDLYDGKDATDLAAAKMVQFFEKNL